MHCNQNLMTKSYRNTKQIIIVSQVTLMRLNYNLRTVGRHSILLSKIAFFDWQLRVELITMRNSKNLINSDLVSQIWSQILHNSSSLTLNLKLKTVQMNWFRMKQLSIHRAAASCREAMGTIPKFIREHKIALPHGIEVSPQRKLKTRYRLN